MQHFAREHFRATASPDAWFFAMQPVGAAAGCNLVGKSFRMLASVVSPSLASTAGGDRPASPRAFTPPPAPALAPGGDRPASPLAVTPLPAPPLTPPPAPSDGPAPLLADADAPDDPESEEVFARTPSDMEGDALPPLVGALGGNEKDERTDSGGSELDVALPPPVGALGDDGKDERTDSGQWFS